MAPFFPGLNDSEIPEILKQASEAGASGAAYTIVRLNGSIGPIFEDWVQKAYPDRAEKVLSQVADCHGGSLNDSRFGTRMRGEGRYADMIGKLFQISKQKYFKGRSIKPFNYTHFCIRSGRQLDLF